MLVIHPDECIDCSLCVPECPIDAIIADDEVTEDQEHLYQLNLDMANQWPSITEMKESLPDADAWEGKPDKLSLLIR